MNKKELDKFLKDDSTKTNRSKYAPYEDEIRYLYEGGASQIAICKFLLLKYGIKEKPSTFHYYFHRNILKEKVKNKIESVNSSKKVYTKINSNIKPNNEKGIPSFETSNTATKVGK